MRAVRPPGAQPISTPEPSSARSRPHAIQTRQLAATRTLAFGAVGLLLYVGHIAFIPIALALLFALILSGPVEALHRLHVSRSISATIILVIVLSFAAGTVNLMWQPAQQWFATAPQTMKVIKGKLRPAVRFMTHVEELRNTAGTIAAPGQVVVPTTAVPVGVDRESAPVIIFHATREAMVSLLSIVVVTLFLLAGGPPMLARMTAAFFDGLNAAHVLRILEDVRQEVGRFYVTTTFINVGLGGATAGAMLLCGMPTPYLWGVVAALLNFVPYAGAITTTIVLTVVAFITFDDVGHVIAVAGSFVGLAMLEGQFVQPLFVGRRLKLNPLLIFLALWFGGLFWGIAGVILATPALLALKVVAENSANGKPMMDFLGPNDPSSGSADAP